jgi:tetratricopeptide (TPR) repeat protein
VSLLSRAPLLSKLRSSESRWLWLAVAVACAVAGSLPGTGAVWTWRRGRALERAGEPDRALDAYRQAVRHDEAEVSWSLRLAAVERARGDLGAAVAAGRRAVEIGGSVGAGPHLADLYADLGRWGDALRVLSDHVAAYPEDHAAGVRLAGTVLELCRWRGSFVASGDGPPDRFRGGYLQEGEGGSEEGERAAALQLARGAIERAVEARPTKASWHVRLGEVSEARGDLARTVQAYEQALELLERGRGRWVLRSKIPWQFELERAYAALGERRVVDPLFDTEVRPAASPPATQPGRVAGLFDVRARATGLVVEGYVTSSSVDVVEVVVDGTVIRSVKVSRDGGLPRFSLPLHRSTVATLPARSTLTVRLPAGEALTVPGGGDELELSVPHGDGALLRILDRGRKLDKKGLVGPTPEEIRRSQDRYLEQYTEISSFFERELGRPLFLLYGTLLGLHRDGDFIPGDDDFDAGYVSDESDPIAVKRETMTFMLALLRAGYDVSFNRRGRLFRVSVAGERFAGLHLDLRPVWFDDGKVWAHNHACFPSDRGDFLPVERRQLRGVEVSVPRRTERFLHRYYGPTWRVPDPGFMYYAEEVDPAVRRNLAEALITPKEVRELQARVRAEAADHPGMGRFVSIGSQDLYPLDDLVE